MHRILTLVLTAALLPSLVAAEGAPGLLESAEAAAVRFATEQSDDEPERHRSMARTWGGVGLIVAGLVVPVGVERGIGRYKRTEYHPGGVLVAAGLVGAGVMFATVWSDVPANSIGFAPLPGGGRVGASFGF
jgi:hypothetical protein